MNLPALLEETVERVRPLADEKPFYIRRNAAGPLPEIELDAGKIKQIFTHLLATPDF